MNNEQVIFLYETVSDLTGKMLRAAQVRDWEHLASLEAHCASHIKILKEGEPEAAKLPEPLRAHKVKMIHQILRHDREIRDLTSPWMAELSAMLNNTTVERRLVNAYSV